jgi:hypothetical protein
MNFEEYLLLRKGLRRPNFLKDRRTGPKDGV